ncbi:MAG: hypothetical protein Q8M18_04795 [Bradyrhizobium sp.]|nr:hypothetical protein [Bradyrhizobium sp.]
MPGLIGASIFSPRPARGYRFHSLQVEIICAPSSSGKVATNCIKMDGWQHQIPLHFKHFTVKKFRRAVWFSAYRGYQGWSWKLQPFHRKIRTGVAVGLGLMSRHPVAVTSAIVTSERFLRRPAGARLQETGVGRKIGRFNQQ